MTTTIAVKEDTLKMLKSIKEENKNDSFDETIKHLIVKTRKPAKSFFGRFKGVKSFKREEIDRFD